MTKNQQLHHDEQMEAMRRDFRAAFPDLYRRMKEMNINLNPAAAEHLCWMVWYAARKVKV